MFSIFEIVSKCVLNVSKVLQVPKNVVFCVCLIKKGVFYPFFSSRICKGETADLGKVNNVVVLETVKAFFSIELIFSEWSISCTRLKGCPRQCLDKYRLAVSLPSKSCPNVCSYFDCTVSLRSSESLDVKLNVHLNEHQPNEQPNAQPNANVNADVDVGADAQGVNRGHLSLRRFRNSMALMALMLYKCGQHVNATRLLLQCGDVETNPGPFFQHKDDEDQTGDADEVDRPYNDDERHADVNDVHGLRDGESLNLLGKEAKPKCDLQVLTLNIRGLSDHKKVRHIINQCYKMSGEARNNFFLFQETFVMRLDILKYLWRGEFHLTAGTGNSKGCLTLVTAPYKIVNSSDVDNRGHVLVLTKDNLNRAEVILVNVYAPNGFDDEKLRFFEELLEKVSETMINHNCNNVILAGDLNIVFSESEIKNRLYLAPERRIAASLKDMLNQLNVEDGWDKVPEKHFTWTSSRTGTPTFSTLDRILYTKDHFKLLTKTTDWALSLSDHAAVKASFELNEVRPNNMSQISRLDPRLLTDPEGCRHMDNRFRELLDQALPDWNPHVRLEHLKMCIRTSANDANGKLKAKLRDSEQELNGDINGVVGELAAEGLSLERKELLMHKLDDLRQLKRCLVEKIGTKLQQKTARKWYNEGELSNKYFFNLLNRKVNDEITNILDENGTEINHPDVIENKIRMFYKDLYESVPENVEANDHLFRHVAEVTPEEAARISEDLTQDELFATLKTCDDSAPGPDGIPYSYLKHFWPFFGPVLLSSWQYSLLIGELPPSHKISYLRLIPKAGKDARVLTNLRPITLSNTDHKLITKTYACKLTNIVADSIGEEQTAYIPGRLINDNVRSILMTMDLANVDLNVNGVVVSLDAKKAFDSVDHRYIRRCLKAFGLENFMGILNVLYKDLRSSIIINGRTVDGYRILKGVKQGDALSCIIFIMCMEPLIRNIKSNAVINSVSSNFLRIAVPKVYSFADDITIVAKNEPQGIQAVFDEYEMFSKASGLLLNAEKTEFLCFNQHGVGRHQFNVQYNGVNHVLDSKDMIKVNGIFLIQDPIQREDINVGRAIEAMERLLMSWSKRRLTLLGRILIIKTFAMSKLIFLMQTLTLSERSYKLFVRVVFKYLWNRNFNAARAPERLKRSIMLTPVSSGGFGMVDIKALGDALDLKSYGRLLATKHPFLSQLRNYLNSDDFFNVRIDVNVDFKLKRSLTLFNSERLNLLKWPVESLSRNLNFRQMLISHSLRSLLSRNGLQSLPYFAIYRRLPGLTIGQLTEREFQSVARFLKYPELGDVIRELLRQPLNVQVAQGIPENDLYPTKEKQLIRLSALSSKQIRLNRMNTEEDIICVYKTGMILAPGEVLAWTGRLKKLTSTRHKNIILRLAHGDIFSNARLARFGLAQDSGCPNCNEQSESILHKIVECPVAREAWLELERAKLALNLNSLSDFSIENLMGAKDRLSKLEFTLQAELIHRLTSINVKYCARELVKRAIKFVGYSERLDTEHKEKIKELLGSH